MTFQGELTFMVGTGRCGSTHIYDLMTRHPRVTWTSNVLNVLPQRPELNRWAQWSVRTERVDDTIRRLVRPAEVYDFWAVHAPELRAPFRDLTARDVRPAAVRRLHAVFARLAPRGSHLVVKFTGWPRIRYLQAVFPQARFVHVVRDGRAVANSLLNVEFWSGWGGPDRWRWGPLDDREADLWASTGHSFVALAGIEWVKLMRAFLACKEEVLNDRYHEVTYERFCDDPSGEAAGIQAFMGLEASEHVRQVASNRTRASRVDAWRRDLEPRDGEVLESVVADTLRTWGYQEPSAGRISPDPR